MELEPTSSYDGNCHCGRYRFEVSLSAKISSRFACSCTLCAKKGYLWLAIPEGALKVTRDDGCLTEYQSAAARDKFCGHCGTGVVGEHLDGPLRGHLLVNIRALQGVNPFSLEASDTIEAVAVQDTRLFEPVTAPSDPPAQHLLSCHCRNVQAELLAPLSSLEAKEDNCSSCVRNAFVGVYPNKDQVRLYGKEHTFEYQYGRKYIGLVYCKACGVNVYNTVYGPPLSIFDSVPPERKEHVMAVYRKNLAVQPLNVRTIENLDLASVRVEKSDEGTEGYVLGL
ncbi:glutathione-dependent formaldehyde-activating enzyme [Lasiosphaeria ovina]|uniref:Glutathione-dependent formaldehyde-activating enzyme n=1 Tax=Lasiosphaeria ovina TaxID=92902 RepID=A0AAE0N7G4_9PEZI|nr:glutathione-dependent formaldehyde-activating enzyme [Lasiosphaeria ovina]